MKSTYRVDELAQEWDVSRRTIYRLIKAGELLSFKVGDTRRIEREAADEFKKKESSGAVKRG